MNISTFYTRMRQEVSEYSMVGRDDTSSLLIWFLENYFRLESQDAIDSICDHTNDKGIDGIYVDDEDEIIYLFQSKFSPNNDQSQGDNDLRNFVGARQWFVSQDTVNSLLQSTASSELKSLVQKSGIVDKTNYKLISAFVTNKHFNAHATEYIGITENLEAYDAKSLFEKYTYFADEEITTPPITLNINNKTKIEYNLPDGTIARVYAIKARELIRLQGIQDRALFLKNVRYGVGNTRVNKSIKKTINDTDEHNNFFLYHNGITIVCSTLDEDLESNRITIGNYAVINGCQSMLTFFENRNQLSNNLFVLVKIVNLNITSPLVKKITNYANNQNSISIRDLRSNDSVQKALQHEFEELFGHTVLYKRKRGESEEGFTTVIEKDFAAQLIEAVYLKKPHNTHLKEHLFGDEYKIIFSRKINAEKIYLAKIIYDIIEENAQLLQHEQIRNYGLSIFFFSHVLSEIMNEDPLGKQILENPREYVTTNIDILKQTLASIWGLITPDINIDIEEYTESNRGFFDYKNLFKNSQFVTDMARRIKSDYIRVTRRNSQDSFSNIYQQHSTTVVSNQNHQ